MIDLPYCFADICMLAVLYYLKKMCCIVLTAVRDRTIAYCYLRVTVNRPNGNR